MTELNYANRNNSQTISLYLMLLLITTAFLVSDWLIHIVAISELIMFSTLLILLFTKNILFDREDFKSFFVVEGFLIVHILLHSITNDSFSIRIAIFNFIKILFFHVFILYVFKYIKRGNRRKELLIFLNIGAIIAVLIGFYIIYSIMNDDVFPYEFFWRFTRVDHASYRLRGTTDLFRARSLFSEPAHFGYFLNMILGVNLFSKTGKSIPLWINCIIILGILSTFSYATIFGSILIILIKMVNFLYHVKDFKVNIFAIIACIAIIALFSYYFRDFLYISIIERTRDILSGADNSAMERLFSSWEYTTRENWFLGNGVGHTPDIQNIYAYFFSDFGIIGFLGGLFFTGYLVKNNVGLGLLFVILNFQKGGYLSPIFSLFILLLILYLEPYSSKRMTMLEGSYRL